MARLIQMLHNDDPEEMFKVFQFSSPEKLMCLVWPLSCASTLLFRSNSASVSLGFCAILTAMLFCAFVIVSPRI